MALTATPPVTPLLSYEVYLTEGEVRGRYDIIEGVRHFMASPTWQHQRTADRITRLFLQFEETYAAGMALSAPFDVLIRRTPKLQTRQPDVLFISHTELVRSGGIPEKGPLTTAPELVVEVVSGSETESVFADKIADYCQIGVRECWKVQMETESVELLQLSAQGIVSSIVYASADTLVSTVFPELRAAVADIFPR